MPFNNSSILSAPRILRQLFSASSISLNASPRKVARDTQLRVRLVLWRTVANVDSIGLVVRICGSVALSPALPGVRYAVGL